jgi:hypothetical protein
MCAEWVGMYFDENNIVDSTKIPKLDTLVNYIEKLRNLEGKSFKFLINNAQKSITEQDRSLSD